MNFIPVTSSNVSAIRYDNGHIDVKFNNGRVYRYPNCSESLFNEFLNAPSKGHFVHAYLKGRGEHEI